jgi:hypothetical protein
MAIVDWLLVVLVIVVVTTLMRRSRRRGGIGTAAVGTVYDMLSEDRRNAVEIIVEQRAEARDPEDKDGHLPALEHPSRPR